MAKAIFHSEFRLRVQGKNLSFWIYPSDEPQSFPRYVIDAAVKAGVAEIVLPKRMDDTATGPKSGD